MSVFCPGRTRDASSFWSSVSYSAWRHVPEPGKQCLKRAGMRGRAGLSPTDAATAGDGAGGPARALGEVGGLSRCSHRRSPRSPPQHFGKPAGSLRRPQNCWMKKKPTHQLQPPPLAPGNVRARAQPAAPNPPGSSRGSLASDVVAGGGRFICLKQSPSPSCRFCWVCWGSAAPSGAVSAMPRRSALAAACACRSAAPHAFFFVFCSSFFF